MPRILRSGARRHTDLDQILIRRLGTSGGGDAAARAHFGRR
ncbi:MAG TPA: hypothetical protein VM847_19415 [Tahibacter sp.]|nr:hypothetical protein [Tahibacter sp.]